MKKIISLFQRNYDGDRRVRNKVTPGAEWVIAGEGIATKKFDGTCCLVRAGVLFKRYEVKPGGRPPANFEPATEVDENTGEQQGWVPVGSGPADEWHRSAWQYWAECGRHAQAAPPDGTYELVGPKVQGNPEECARHELVRHGEMILQAVPRDFDGLREWLSAHRMEGIVWHHSDGRMVKIKTRDFGLQR